MTRVDETRTVVGVFSEIEKAEEAFRQLEAMGFNKDEISVLADDPDRFHRHTDIDAKTPHDMGKGASAGAITGGVVGGFAGLVASVGALAIPGFGPVLAAGPIAATISGLVAGGAVGTAVGALAGLGISKEEAKLYEDNLRSGDILIFVHVENESFETVSNILHHPQAEHEPRFAAGSLEDSIFDDPSAEDADIEH